MVQSRSHRSIADRSWDVRQTILDVLDKARTTECVVESQNIEDILDRFKLWTGNLGALHQAHKRLSLESRLADSPEVQDQICEQLDDMQEALRDLLTLCSENSMDLVADNNEEQDSESPSTVILPADDLLSDPEYASKDSEAISIVNMVCQCLKALFRIGILVRKSTPRDRFERALQQSEFAFTAQFDINYIEERYPKLARKDSKWLATRLGDANAKRRQFINYVRDHKAKLEVEGTGPAAEAATMAQSSKATTFAVPQNLSASEFLDAPLEVEGDSISLVSASTAFDNDTSLRLPSLSDLCPDGEYFECPICFTLQSFRKEKSWKYVEVHCAASWPVIGALPSCPFLPINIRGPAFSRFDLTGHRIHAYRDLKAYVCTSGGHECAQKMFGDRDTWFSHELKHHYSLFICKFCGCQSTDGALLQQHILNDHGASSKNDVVSVIEQGKLVLSQLKAQNCPFCDDWATILSQRRHQTEGRTSSNIRHADITVSLTHFKRHVATHQEQLAIFAVPRTVDDDEQRSHKTDEPNSEAASSKDRESATSDKGVHPMDESTTSGVFGMSLTWVHLSGLPPDIRKIDIETQCLRNQLVGFTVMPPTKGSALIGFTDPENARQAVESFNDSTHPGVTIQARFAKESFESEVAVESSVEPYPERLDAIRAQKYIDAAETHFNTILLPMCKEFIARSPPDPQKRQDQSIHIITMIRQAVWSTVNFIDASNDELTMARKTEVLEIVDGMLEQIRAVGDRRSHRDEDDMMPTAIVIKNIPFHVRKEVLHAIMMEMNLPQPYAFNYHFDNGIFRGVAFADFSSADETRQVIDRMNQLDVQGRKLRVEYKHMLSEDETKDAPLGNPHSTMSSNDKNDFLTELARERGKRQGTPTEAHHEYKDVIGPGNMDQPCGDMDVEDSKKHEYEQINSRDHASQPLGHGTSEGHNDLLKQHQKGYNNSHTA